MRKQKVSKYLNKEFDNGWVCTGINIAQASLTHKNGGPRYWYAFERKTSDGKFDKWIRVEANTAAKIYKGLVLVEDICKEREQGLDKRAKHSINYNFIGKKNN